MTVTLGAGVSGGSGLALDPAVGGAVGAGVTAAVAVAGGTILGVGTALEVGVASGAGVVIANDRLEVSCGVAFGAIDTQPTTSAAVAAATNKVRITCALPLIALIEGDANACRGEVTR